MIKKTAGKCWMLFFVLFAVQIGYAQKIHTPEEIIRLTHNSKLNYQIEPLKEPVSLAREERALSNQLYMETKDGESRLQKYSLSKESNEVLMKGEEAFNNKQYDEALKCYKSAQDLEPEYSYANTLIGDVFFFKGDYKKAKKYFEKAIKENYIDFQAHWFLADTLWKLGEKDKAVTELTIAHLLNVNHQEIRKKLVAYRDEVKRPWKDWEYNPQVLMSMEGNTIHIKTATEWIGYALAKALWKYEPGYAEMMAGPDYADQSVHLLEEKEALGPLVMGNSESFNVIRKIVGDGFVNEMIFYEIVAPKDPLFMLDMPKEPFMRMVEYIDKYH